MAMESTGIQGNILLVDDNEDDLLLTSEYLEDSSHTVLTARDGIEALGKIAAEKVDLVLLDERMPGMNGMDVLHEIRKDRGALDLPVIMLTGMEQTDNVIEAFSSGANDYITKPIKQEILIARIQTQLALKFQREDLYREKDFTESVLDSLFEMIIGTDLDRKITQFNRAAEKTFGFSRSEVLGKPVNILYSVPEQGSTIHNKTFTERGFSGEIQNRKKNGETFLAQLSAAIHRDSDGRPVGLVGISHDLTEKHRLEAEKEHLLKQKEEFLALASHDLKSPLASLHACAALLQQKFLRDFQDEDERQELVESIKRNAVYMAGIVDDYLDLHLIEEGKTDLRETLVDLREIAKEVGDFNREYAKSKAIDLLPNFPDVPCPVWADKSRITQVAQNLLGNSIKFCSEGDSIEFGVEPADSASRFFVRDNGPGIPEAEIDLVFDRYSRLSNRPTGNEKSTGLGLAICKLLIDLHGGEIGVRNNADKGCTFHFTLRDASSKPAAQ